MLELAIKKFKPSAPAILLKQNKTKMIVVTRYLVLVLSALAAKIHHLPLLQIMPLRQVIPSAKLQRLKIWQGVWVLVLVLAFIPCSLVA